MHAKLFKIVMEETLWCLINVHRYIYSKCSQNTVGHFGKISFIFGQFLGAFKSEKVQKMALKWPQKATKGQKRVRKGSEKFKSVTKRSKRSKNSP